MKKILLFLYASVFVLGAGCSDPAESLLPRPEEQAAEADGDKTVVSRAEAARVAEAFFLDQGGGDGLRTRSEAGALKIPSSIEAIEADAGDTAMHVINYPGGGWAIVSATRDYHPVLAFSDEGSFVLAPDMGPVDVWISETKEAIRVAGTLDDDAKASIDAEWAQLGSASDPQLSAPRTRAGYDPVLMNLMNARMGQLRAQGYGAEWGMVPLISAQSCIPDMWSSVCSRANSLRSPLEYTILVYKKDHISQQVGPLMTTLWHQDYPFNGDCNGKKAGCGTIAVAQIMRSFKYAGSSNYDWDRIFENPTTGEGHPPGHYDELCRFIKNVGHALGINYNTNSSGVSFNDIKAAFSAFNYTYTDNGHGRSDVINWLSNQRKPVCMTGSTSDFLGLPTGDAHAWVCDGVKWADTNTTFFVEFLNTSNNTWFYNSPGWTPSNPGLETKLYPAYFHHNWGWNPSNSNATRNGWFIEDDVNTNAGDFDHVRRNIYARHQ